MPDERRLEVAERLVAKPARCLGPFLAGECCSTYLLLSLGAVVMVVPFIWMVLTSLKPAPELLEFSFLPTNPTLANYAAVLDHQRLWPLVFQQPADRRDQHGQRGIL